MLLVLAIAAATAAAAAAPEVAEADDGVDVGRLAGLLDTIVAVTCCC